jgi:uncharacterized protein YfbU (UPF0304 family)
MVIPQRTSFMADISFSKTERLSLSVQYRILAKLDPEHGYDRLATILERGYTRDYDEVMESVREEVSEEDCKFVYDTLCLYNDLQFSYDQLSEQEQAGIGSVAFPGFDMNDDHEGILLGYARFLKSPMMFASLRTASTEFNSHMPMADRYRTMLGKWNSMGTPRPRVFTAEQMKALLR